MLGRRFDNPDSVMPEPGDYGRDAAGEWYGLTPNGYGANLSRHDVVEHEDGTITVGGSPPSILVSWCGRPVWHGFLERGVWREA